MLNYLSYEIGRGSRIGKGGSNSLLVIFYGFYSFAPMCNGCSDWSVYNKQRSGPFVDDLNNS